MGLQSLEKAKTQGTNQINLRLLDVHITYYKINKEKKILTLIF